MLVVENDFCCCFVCVVFVGVSLFLRCDDNIEIRLYRFENDWVL